METVYQWIVLIIISVFVNLFVDRHKKREISFNEASYEVEPASESPIYDKDSWEILGIEPTENLNEIKKAYRRKIKQYHPDIAGPSSHQKTIELNKAYRKVLKNGG